MSRMEPPPARIAKKRKVDELGFEAGECIDPSTLTWDKESVRRHVTHGNVIQKEIAFLSGKTFDFIHCSYIVATSGAVHQTYLPCSRDALSGVVKKLNLPGSDEQNRRFLEILRVTSNIADKGIIYYPPGSSYAVVFPELTESSHFRHASKNTWLKSNLSAENPISKAVCRIAQAKITSDPQGLQAFLQSLSSYMRASRPTDEFNASLDRLTVGANVETRCDAALALSNFLTGPGARTFLLSFGVHGATVEELTEFIRKQSYRTAISSILGCELTSHLPLLAKNTPFLTLDESNFVSKPLNELTDTEFMLVSTTRADYNAVDLFGRNPTVEVLVHATGGVVECLQKVGRKKANRAEVKLSAVPGLPLRKMFEVLHGIIAQEGARSSGKVVRGLLVQGAEVGTSTESFELDL